MKTVFKYLGLVGVFIFFFCDGAFSASEKVESFIKVLDEVIKNPSLYKKYEEELTQLIQKDESRERKLVAVKITSGKGFPPALQFLLNELKTPLDPAVPEVNRKNYTESAQILGTALEENPSVLTSEIREEIKSILVSKDPAHTAAQNDLNRLLPQALVAELDSEITDLRLHSSNEDPCQVMCRIGKALAEQITDKFTFRGDAYLESDQGKSAFDIAVRSLLAEFLLKANRSGCEIAGIQEKIKNLLQDTHDNLKLGNRATESNKKVNLPIIEYSDLGKESLDKAREFLEKASPDIPLNGASVYLLLQSHRLVDTLVELNLAPSEPAVSEIHQALHEKIGRILQKRSELIRGEGGSLVTTYSLAALGASSPKDSEIQKKIAHIFSEKREEVRLQDIPGFPYNFSKDMRIDSERGRAGRTVVAELAIFKGAPAEQRLKNADNLLLSLVRYDRFFRDIFSGIGLNRTHDFGDPDLLAPYYGPSTIPYAFEALSALENEKELGASQKETLGKVRVSLEKKLLGMFEPNGLFQKQYEPYYSSASYYDNALTGLALENACRNRRSQPLEKNEQLKSRLQTPSPNSLEKHQ